MKKGRKDEKSIFDLIYYLYKQDISGTFVLSFRKAFFEKNLILRYCFGCYRFPYRFSHKRDMEELLKMWGNNSELQNRFEYKRTFKTSNEVSEDLWSVPHRFMQEHSPMEMSFAASEILDSSSTQTY